MSNDDCTIINRTPHADFWTNLMQEHALRKRARTHGWTRWTRDEVVACVQSWALEHERPPRSSELSKAHQLPDYSTIRHFWGSVPALYGALGWPYSVYKVERREPGTGRQRRRSKVRVGVKNTACLKCDAFFHSPDVKNIRVCMLCKGTEEWAADASWMNGSTSAKSLANALAR